MPRGSGVTQNLILYRYESIQTIYGARVWLSTFNVVKETPCGYWITSQYHLEGPGEWRRKNAKRKFAHETKRDALISFMERKKRQIAILKNQISHAESCLRVAKEMEKTNEFNSGTENMLLLG